MRERAMTMTDNVCWVPEGALEHLKEAERSLEAAQAREQTAEEALREAKQDTAKAEAKVKEAIHEVEHPRQFPVEVVYDGGFLTFEPCRALTHVCGKSARPEISSMSR
jgi:hypothetical protein